MITSRSKCRPRNNSSTLFSSLTVGPQLSKGHCNRRGRGHLHQSPFAMDAFAYRLFQALGEADSGSKKAAAAKLGRVDGDGQAWSTRCRLSASGRKTTAAHNTTLCPIRSKWSARPLDNPIPARQEKRLQQN